MGSLWPMLRRPMGQEVDRGETGEGLEANFPSQLDCPEGSHQHEPKESATPIASPSQA